ncbi:MAG: hypothetical protein AB8B93_07690 [Pseudomonadales bacterium]
MTQNRRQRLWNNGYLALLGYLSVAMAIWALWSVRDQRFIVAGNGTGYALGILGASLMLLLLLYPLRKRARFLRNAGPVRHWFRIHMILGILGPLFVLLHSNFSLGSLNSQVALICTIVVSTSGIIGRYLYAKVHNGMYGHRVTVESISKEIAEAEDSDSSITALLPTLNARLQNLASTVNTQPQTITGSLTQAIALTFKLSVSKRVLRKEIRSHLVALANKSTVVSNNQKRLQRTAFNYLEFRLTVLRKFAQLQAAERLFSLWHIVHYPLFIVLVVAAVIHVVAVHMY